LQTTQARMSDHKNRSFPQRLGWALAGLVHALRSEHSLKLQLSIFAGAVTGLIVLRPEALWWALVLLASAGVIAAELINTALEHLADHLHPAWHPQIRIVKDCAAAAVLVAVLGAIAVGIALALHLLWR
jgi:undecaprenol kinase